MKYTVKMRWGEPFERKTTKGIHGKDYKILPREHSVDIYFENGEISTYGYLDISEIKNINIENYELDLSGTYISDIDYKNDIGCLENVNVRFCECFFDKKIDFSDAIFGKGDVDFYHARFGNSNADFSYAVFNGGIVDFSYVKFENGNVDFTCSSFENAEVSFFEVLFGDGNVDFHNASFRESEVSFYNIEFGKGDVIFSFAEFIGGDVGFSYIKFGEGDVIFSRVNFGEKEVIFSVIRFSTGHVNFDNTDFGTGVFTFEHSFFDKANVNFSNVKGNIINFIKCNFNGINNFRALLCDELNLTGCIFDGTLDLSHMYINSLNLSDTRNIGFIFIEWEKERVKEIILNQRDVLSSGKKSYQFRLLKENFNRIGQYEDEDCAYFEFKRYELIEKHKGALLFLPKKLIFEIIGGYGTKPKNVFISMIVTILFFAGIYTFCPNLIYSGDIECEVFSILLRSIYYSGITFLTIGYGDISPTNGFAQMLSVFEGFLGIFLMSYFTVSFVRKLLR